MAMNYIETESGKVLCLFLKLFRRRSEKRQRSRWGLNDERFPPSLNDIGIKFKWTLIWRILTRNSKRYFTIKAQSKVCADKEISLHYRAERTTSQWSEETVISMITRLSGNLRLLKYLPVRLPLRLLPFASATAWQMRDLCHCWQTRENFLFTTLLVNFRQFISPEFPLCVRLESAAIILLIFVDSDDDSVVSANRGGKRKCWDVFGCFRVNVFCGRDPLCIH